MNETLQSLEASIVALTVEIKKLNSPTIESQVPEYFSPKQLSEFLGISLKTVHSRSAPKAVRPFRFKVMRSGRRLLFKRSDVIEALEAGKVWKENQCN